MLRYIHQIVRDDDGLRGLGQHADGELLFGVDGEHPLPDVFAHLWVVGVVPVIRQQHQPFRGLHIGGRPGLSDCLVVLSPHRPGKEFLIGGRQIGRRGRRPRKPVVPAVPHRRHGPPRIDPVAQDVAVQRAHDQTDAQISPCVSDDRQRVFFLAAFACGLDHELHRAAVGQFAQAGGGAFSQAHVVKQRVGVGEVHHRPRMRIIVVVKRALRQGGHAAFAGKAKIERAVDHASIDAEAQRTAKTHVAHDIAPHRVGEVQVGIDRDLAGGAVGPKQSAVFAAVRLAFLEDRDIGEIEPARLQVDLACVGLGRDQPTADHGHLHHVDIGQLHAPAVDTVEIGVSYKQLARAVLVRGVDPRLEGRQRGIVELVHVVAFVVQRGPAFDSRGFDLFDQRVRVGELHVEL